MSLLLFIICLTPRILFFSLLMLSDSMFVLNSAYFSLSHLFLFFFFNDGEKWHSLLPGLSLSKFAVSAELLLINVLTNHI